MNETVSAPTENSPKKTNPNAYAIHEVIHGEKPFRLISRNEEIVETTGEAIVRACQLDFSSRVWQDNLFKMIDYVRQWCGERQGVVQLVVADFRTDKIVFHLCPTSETYDFDLGIAQAELSAYLNTRGNIGYVELRQVPRWDIGRFVSDTALRIWPTGEEQTAG